VSHQCLANKLKKFFFSSSFRPGMFFKQRALSEIIPIVKNDSEN
jgi:hypothetical protein